MYCTRANCINNTVFWYLQSKHINCTVQYKTTVRVHNTYKSISNPCCGYHYENALPNNFPLVSANTVLAQVVAESSVLSWNTCKLRKHDNWYLSFHLPVWRSLYSAIFIISVFKLNKFYLQHNYTYLINVTC